MKHKFSSLAIGPLIWCLLSLSQQTASANPIFGGAFAPSGRSYIYVPGTEIPDGYFASTAIFRPLRASNGQLLSELEPDNDLRGSNTQQLYFSSPIYGNDSYNMIRFDGVAQPASDIGVGTPFLLGYLTHRNGTYLPDYPTLLADIEIQTFGPPPVPGRFTQTYNGTIVRLGTLNLLTNTAEQNADTIYIVGSESMGASRIYEGEVGTIEVWARFGSLNLYSFGDIVSTNGSAFYTPAQDDLPSSFVPSSTGNGTVTVVSIPEPNSALMIGGAMAMFLIWRRFR